MRQHACLSSERARTNACVPLHSALHSAVQLHMHIVTRTASHQVFATDCTAAALLLCCCRFFAVVQPGVGGAGGVQAYRV
jgi:hypothetical protein